MHSFTLPSSRGALCVKCIPIHFDDILSLGMLSDTVQDVT